MSTKMRATSYDPAEYDELSSPDPLVSSTTTSRSTKSASRRKQSTPSPSKHNTTRTISEHISILPSSSPSRAVTEQTLSPWKIRVTVEAEPEDGSGHFETVSRTMVPLKGEGVSVQDATNHNKKSQSRPRRNSTSNRRQRSTTPTADRRQRQSLTDLDIVVLGDDADEDEWGKRRKASPKKKKPQEKTQKKAADTTQTDVVDFSVRQDTDVEEEGLTSTRDDSPELRQIDLNRVSIRSRADSIKQKPHVSEEAINSSEQVYKRLPNPISANRRTVSANSAMTYPTPSPTASERGRSVEVEENNEHAEGFDTIMESEGFTMIDFESIPSVRQMLSSPLENQAEKAMTRSESPAESEVTVRRHTPNLNDADILPPQPLEVNAHPPSLILPEDDSDISSTVPSSPPSFLPRSQVTRQKSPLSSLQVPAQPRNRIVTPQIYSSPRLPSPPKQPLPRERSTPDSAKALRAGLALQSAIVPTNQILRSSDHSKETAHARSSSDELFEGYDSGTQRELRAGLRFGEELAKKQAARLEYKESNIQPTHIWRGESVISRTPIQTLGESAQSKVIGNACQPQIATSKSATPLQATHELRYLDTTAKREQQWDRERKAVSRQIQNASPSQVVIIDSDDEADLRETSYQVQDQSMQDMTIGDDGDIWLEEAKDASSSPREHHEDVRAFVRPQSPRQEEQAKQDYEKPRRSVIPSPWRRGEDVEGNNSTIVTNGEEMSGLFWKQTPSQNNVGFGATAINKVRNEFKQFGESGFETRRTSGAFDIDKMLNTPKRIRKSLEKEQNERLPSNQARQYPPVPNTEDTSNDTVQEEGYAEEESLDSQYSDGSESSLAEPQRVPVNFNESATTQQMTPTQQNRAETVPSPLTQRPPTPRSAMKGTRQSFGATNGLKLTQEDMDQAAARRVVFAERSRGVDVDWHESSSSVLLPSEAFRSSPIVEHQRHHEQRQLVLASSPLPESRPEQEPNSPETLQTKQLQSDPNQKGWLGWLWKGEQPQSDSQAVPVSLIDGTTEAKQPTIDPEILHDEDWAPTSRSSAPSQTQPTPKSKPRQSLPSYLLSPSYPSDPTRSTETPLTTHGKFNNTHFRTLHILHRKSQRPRFHAPNLSTCRPELRALVSKKWQLSIDECDSGLREFKWTVSKVEAQVLERFCRELEFDNLRLGLSQSEIDERVEEWCGDDGIWSGQTSHGTKEVRWEWDVEILATWLGRLVIGEVVRKEEFGGKKSTS